MSLQLGAMHRGLKPYRYDPQGLARVAGRLPARAAPNARWPAIALLAAFLGIFCRADAPGGSAPAADHLTPADRSSEMIHRHAGVVAAMVLASGATAQDAVQWRIEDGGNGHWYAGVNAASGATWTEARDLASSAGGALVSCESSIELQFVLQQFSAQQAPSLWQVQSINPGALMGPWIGASQAFGSKEPSGGWIWLSGVPFDPQDGINCCNNNCSGVQEDRIHLYARQESGWITALNDLTDDPSACSAPILGGIIEWSADCNSDGIVDFGQIRAGELEDVNANNIPDCCESSGNCDPCPADVIEDGVVNGVDLAAVINAWGTAGGKLPRTDVDGSGVVDASDLAAVLSSWGPCQP